MKLYGFLKRFMAGLANACCAKVRRYESSRASWHKRCLQAPCRNGHAGTCGWGCGARSRPCGSRGHGQGFPTATTCLRFLCAVCSFHLCSLGSLSYTGSGWDSRYAVVPTPSTRCLLSQPKELLQAGLGTGVACLVLELRVCCKARPCHAPQGPGLGLP